MKETPLTPFHLAVGAKMADFAGFYMPISYAGIQQEHQAVRTKAAAFDVSHMGEFILKGPQSLDLIQLISTNDASTLQPGKVQYACMTNHNGGIIDDLLIYRLGENEYMLVVNASNIKKDFDWISKQHKHETRLIDISDRTGLIAVQGPEGSSILQQFTSINLDSIKYYHFEKGDFCGFDNVLISATGYTGAGGFEIYADNAKIPEIWNQIMQTGIMPAGLGARDTLRLEMGYCLYGNDLDDYTTPLEAGLKWITKFDKPYFIGREKLESKKPEKKLTGFILDDRRVPRHGYSIKNQQGVIIGKVTSGTMSPTLGKPIGLGYVPIEVSKPGNTIFIDMGSKIIEAKTIQPPFI
jgi:aminomethyltransferase